jgi:predicted permease
MTSESYVAILGLGALLLFVGGLFVFGILPTLQGKPADDSGKLDRGSAVGPVTDDTGVPDCGSAVGDTGVPDCDASADFSFEFD